MRHVTCDIGGHNITFELCVTEEPFFQFFTENFRSFLVNVLSKIEKPGYAVLRCFKSYIMTQDFNRIVCSSSEISHQKM